MSDNWQEGRFLQDFLKEFNADKSVREGAFTRKDKVVDDMSTPSAIMGTSVFAGYDPCGQSIPIDKVYTEAPTTGDGASRRVETTTASFPTKFKAYRPPAVERSKLREIV